MRAFERVLASHEPFPAVVLDRRWNVVRANDAARRLTDLAVDPDRLRPNALRLASHPGGLAMRIMNLAAWSGAYMAGVRSPVDPINRGDRRRDRLDRRR